MAKLILVSSREPYVLRHNNGSGVIATRVRSGLLGSVRFDAEAWRAFRRVSQRFADAVLEAYEPGDKIWVLDHALCLVPGILREARPDAAIAASWTIPVAPPDVLRALPWAPEVI